MRTEEQPAAKAEDKRRREMLDAEPSDAPLAIVYLGIICCALTIVLLVTVGAT